MVWALPLCGVSAKPVSRFNIQIFGARWHGGKTAPGTTTSKPGGNVYALRGNIDLLLLVLLFFFFLFLLFFLLF